MMRRSPDSKLDSLMKLRVQMSSWPSTLVSEGAILMEASHAAEVEVSVKSLVRGASLYGQFGAHADEQVHSWENSGIFSGELAMTISLTRINTPAGKAWFRSMDTPYISSGGEIWCLCELRRLSSEEYAIALRQMGATLVSIPSDHLA